MCSLGCLDVVLFRDIIDLANCESVTEGLSDGRTDTTSYRDAEAHLKTRISKVIFLQVISSWPEGTNTVCYVAHLSLGMCP